MNYPIDDKRSFIDGMFRKTRCLSLKQLIDYTEYRLNKKETHDVEKHLADCRLCSESVESLASMPDKDKYRRLAVSTRAAFQSTLSNKGHHAYRPRFIYAIAAVLLIAVSTTLMIVSRKPANEILFDTYYRPHPAALRITRGQETPDALTQALLSYRREEYVNAITQLNAILDDEPGNTKAWFYAGISHLALHEPMESVHHFKCVLESGNNEFVEPARWYCALAYIKANDIHMAEDLLKQISEQDGPYRQNSVRILKDLK